LSKYTIFFTYSKLFVFDETCSITDEECNNLITWQYKLVFNCNKKKITMDISKLICIALTIAIFEVKAYESKLNINVLNSIFIIQ